MNSISLRNFAMLQNNIPFATKFTQAGSHRTDDLKWEKNNVDEQPEKRLVK